MRIDSHASFSAVCKDWRRSLHNERYRASGRTDMDLILFNGRITTFDSAKPRASAVAIQSGEFVAVGDDAEILALRTAGTNVLHLRGRSAIPGLNDSHTHLIRGGLSYNLELRWDGVPSLADALA